MSNLMRASVEWANRPSDECFDGKADMLVNAKEDRRNSSVKGEDGTPPVALSSMHVEGDGKGLLVVGKSGEPLCPTNWAFTQLCRHVKAPASYLSSLPGDLAADNLNWGLKNSQDNVQLLLTKKGGKVDLRAVTSPTYTRLWDAEWLHAVDKRLGDTWRCPPARPAPGRTDDPRVRPATKEDVMDWGRMGGGVQIKEGDMIAPAGAYRGPQDSFLFMVNPTKKVDDGSDGGLSKGVFFSNSEVGSRSFKITTFLLESVCGNHIVWGASDIFEIKMIHRGDKITKYWKEIDLRVRRYSQEGVVSTENLITAARLKEIAPDKEGVVEFLATLRAIKSASVSQTTWENVFDTATEWEHTAKCPPTTVWGMIHGLTRYSQTLPYAGDRDKLDRVGGKLLNLAL